jgi:hypothetical protein
MVATLSQFTVTVFGNLLKFAEASRVELERPVTATYCKMLKLRAIMACCGMVTYGRHLGIRLAL